MFWETVVRVLTITAIAVLIAALILERRPGPTKEMMTALQRLNAQANKLVGRKVALVDKLPGKADRDPTVVYLVHAQNVLQSNPIIPWEGLPVQRVTQEFQRKFGVRHVVTDTQLRKRANQVTIVYDPHTNLTKKVVVPRRWSMPAPRARVSTPRHKIAVVVNPRATTAFARRTLVVKTDARGVAVSAAVRG